MPKNKLRPEIRFEGYLNDWEFKTLKEVSNIYDGIHETPNYTKYGVKFLSVENIKDLKTNKYISQKDFQTKYKTKPEYNDILMTRIGDVGTTNVIKENRDFAYYVSLALIKPNKDIDSDFLSNLIKNNNTQKSINDLSLTDAVPPKINLGKIYDIELFITKDIKEQQKIGTLFRSIDDQIWSQNQKIQKLENVKKELLQKMFADKDNLVPKIRFEEFEGEWEKTEFKNIYIFAKEGSTPDTKNKNNYNFGSIPFAKIEETNDKYIFKTKSKITEKGFRNSSTWLIPKNSILYSNGATIGNVSINKIELCSKQGILGIILNNNFDLEFVYYLLNTDYFKKEVETNVTIGTIAAIPLFRLKNIEIFFTTNLLEQQKIAKLFTTLDNVIKLNKQKLEKLQNIKTTLLQKMFV
ncbi:restriction endonuclease subunit S [Mycoplasma leonicaptivi]|uniref:restriction endonuclease subunit S n=1 Tax=Mycoplasma leonicaptivi TaxID=36742 RepID=UPI0004842FEB|nr:restriction endonuclease subunit S [Mycoplasma leonicaptivi]